MLEMERTDEGSIRVRNRRQSEVVRDAAAARRVAHHWGHTSLSIEKALAEMANGDGTNEPRTGWKVRRATAEEPAPARAPAAEPAVATDAKPARAKRTRRTKAAAPEAAGPAPAEETPPPARKPARRTRRKAEAAPPAPEPEIARPAPEPEPAPEPKTPRRRARKAPATPAPSSRDAGERPDPRARALELARELARELRAIEKAELAFARGPWAELRASAEHVAACLSGRSAKPRGGAAE